VTAKREREREQFIRALSWRLRKKGEKRRKDREKEEERGGEVEGSARGEGKRVAEAKEETFNRGTSFEITRVWSIKPARYSIQYPPRRGRRRCI